MGERRLALDVESETLEAELAHDQPLTERAQHEQGQHVDEQGGVRGTARSRRLAACIGALGCVWPPAAAGAPRRLAKDTIRARSPEWLTHGRLDGVDVRVHLGRLLGAHLRGVVHVEPRPSNKHLHHVAVNSSAAGQRTILKSTSAPIGRQPAAPRSSTPNSFASSRCTSVRLRLQRRNAGWSRSGSSCRGSCELRECRCFALSNRRRLRRTALPQGRVRIPEACAGAADARSCRRRLMQNARGLMYSVSRVGDRELAARV